MLSWSHEDVRLALNAIVMCSATEEAYEVAATRGWHELFPGVIFREEFWMEAETARAIVKRAQKDEIYDGPLPEDDASAIKEAEQLVEMAEQAWASHVRGPEVEAILKMAAGDQNGGEPEDEGETSDDDTEDHAPPESDKSEDSDDSDSDVTPSPFRDLDEALNKTEPWEGYGDMTVSDVTEGINIFMGDMEEDAEGFQEILQNVWAFEMAHKERKRILNHVVEAWKKSGGEIEDEPEAEEETSGDDEGSVEGEAESGPEAETEDDSSNDSDADDDSESETSAESDEGGADDDAPEEKDEIQKGGSDGSSGEAKLIEKIEAELAKERADGIPTPPESELPDLPWNWSEISDRDLQNFHMQYASWAFYKSYQRTKHERVAMHAKQAAEELTHAKRLNISNYDEKNKEKKVGLIEAEIAQDPTIKKWRRMQSKHERMSLSARQELDSLHKMVESLSRLETMRHNSWERAGK